MKLKGLKMCGGPCDLRPQAAWFLWYASVTQKIPPTTNRVKMILLIHGGRIVPRALNLTLT